MNEQDGAQRIAQERWRQREREGFSAEHDTEHDQGELMDAALCYIGAAATSTAPNARFALAPVKDPPADWPWAEEWWKPTWSDPVRNLVKAGALIAAEIDRLVSGATGDADEHAVEWTDPVPVAIYKLFCEGAAALRLDGSLPAAAVVGELTRLLKRIADRLMPSAPNSRRRLAEILIDAQLGDGRMDYSSLIEHLLARDALLK
ncbi:MAG: hypothetical protein ACRDNK_19535 [Solirubrobacteraceae bacterium]